MDSCLLRAGAIACGLLASSGAWSAGGHHAVDDAAILDARACELESWFARSQGGQRLLHAGAGCGVGPVELGVAAEYERQGSDSAASYAVQAKWARQWAPGFSAGLSVTPTWQAHVRPRFQATTVAALATWTPRDDLAIHANLGRDFVRGDADMNRSGVSVDWTPREGLSATLERYVEQRTHFVRAGLRWNASEDWTLDFSRAQRLRGPGESNWTFGLTRRLSL